MGRRYGDFMKLHKRLLTEFPGKALPALPRKNKSSTSSTLHSSADDDNESLSSVSTLDTNTADDRLAPNSLAPRDGHHRHRRSRSRSSIASVASSIGRSSRGSGELGRETVLYREEQRVSLRAFLRLLLQNKRFADSKALAEFLNAQPTNLTDEEVQDVEARKAMDAVRVEEQNRFYEIARARAAELDVYMERFRRDIVEASKWA